MRAYIDTFFLDGSLTPVEQEERRPSCPPGSDGRDPRSQGRCPAAVPWPAGESSRQKSPAAEVSHREWQQAAQRWAELVVLRWEWDEALEAADRTAWTELQATVEDAFGRWMMNRYGSLHNLPYHQQPVMVHQIPRFMAVERNRKKLSQDCPARAGRPRLRSMALAEEESRSLRQGVAVPGIDGLRLGSDTHFRHPPVNLCRGAAALLPGLAGNDIEGEGALAAVLGGPRRSAGRASIWSRTSTARTTRTWRRRWAIPASRSWGSFGTRSMTLCTECRCRPQGCTTRCVCGLRRAICNNCSLDFTKRASPST